MQFLTISCAFLTQFSPTQLTALLAQWTTCQKLPLYPVWLHNDDNDVIGFLPKTTFCLSISEQITKAHRIMEDTFCYTTQNQKSSLNDFIQTLIQYGDSHRKDYIHSQKNFYDGLMGFVSYDSCANSMINHHADDQKIGSFFGHYDIYLTCQKTDIDHQWQLTATTEETKSKINTITSLLKNIIHQTQFSTIKPLILSALWQKKEYQTAFEKTQKYLHAGDCYQINLTQCWQGNLDKDSLLAQYLPVLHQTTKAPFAGYLKVGEFELLSCSPELFFTFYKNDKNDIAIITKPIKGTRPRSQNSDQDLMNKNELKHSQKDKAENVMIVDLLRNDLGKYAHIGSVSVPKLFDIESFSNVHHMVSTISATLKDDVHPLTVLFGSLPAGSITGAPKKRAIEIIKELEVQERGAYCGTLGFMNFDGTGQFNVLIRTLQAQKDTVSLWAGGGITVSSVCQAEYQECFDKVGVILSILAGKLQN